jgi:hypothetical protein
MTPGEMAGWAGLVLASVLAVVCLMLAWRLGQVERRLKALTAGAGVGSDKMSLGDLVAAQGKRLDASREDLEKLRNAVANLDSSVVASVQCIGLVRYNPFEDTGGDQSFALALLDKRGNGVVISSLHGRTATRFYAKPVKGGTSPLSLSNEETQAVKQALGS